MFSDERWDMMADISCGFPRSVCVGDDVGAGVGSVVFVGGGSEMVGGFVAWKLCSISMTSGSMMAMDAIPMDSMAIILEIMCAISFVLYLFSMTHICCICRV